MVDFKVILDRFLEETKFDTNPNILVVIAYGSRVTSTNQDNSDLDIFAISNLENNYKIKRIIEGCFVECNVFSINSLESLIEEKSQNNDTYFLSVLKNGVLVKNIDYTFQWFESIVANANILGAKKAKISKKLLSELNSLLFAFKNSYNNLDKDSIDYYYFNLIECIRKIYHKKFSHSPISAFKVYKIYNNKEEYVKNYLLKMPNDNFILKYQKAILVKNNEERMIILDELLKLINVSEKKEVFISENDLFFSKKDIKLSLASLHDKLYKVLEALMYNYPWVDSVYFMFLNQIYELYCKLDKKDELFENSFQSSLKIKDNNSRINALEQLFCLVDKDYRFDYDDCDIIR